MKYKLIHRETKVETSCEKVTIDGFDYYVSNEKPKLGGFYIDDTNQIRQSVTDDEEYWDRRSGYKIIIATNNPNIDIPKVVDIIQQLASDVVNNSPSLTEDRDKVICFTGWIDGYLKSQETHPFSEDDMIDFAEWCFINFWVYDVNKKIWENLYKRHDETDITTKELLQLWKEQQTKIVYYE